MNIEYMKKRLGKIKEDRAVLENQKKEALKTLKDLKIKSPQEAEKELNKITKEVNKKKKEKESENNKAETLLEQYEEE